MEGILLDTMYDLPGLDRVEQVVIGPEVVEGKARPLFIYAERGRGRQRLGLSVRSIGAIELRA